MAFRNCESVKCIILGFIIYLLRNHGVMDTTLQIVFKSVAVAKLVYAASAWYGFCTAADRDRLEASALASALLISCR